MTPRLLSAAALFAFATPLAGEDTLDALLAQFDVEFLAAPEHRPASTSNLVNGDNYKSSIGFGSPAAIAGYPHRTVPMGAIERLLVGISLYGAKWRDFEVLQVAAAYEAVRSATIPEPSFQRWEPDSGAEQ